MPRSQPWGYWGGYSRGPSTRSGERRWETEVYVRGQVTCVGSWVASCKGLWKVVHSPWEVPKVELWSTPLSSQLVRAVPGMVTPQHLWPMPFSCWACMCPAGTLGQSTSADVMEPLAQTLLVRMRGDGRLGLQVWETVHSRREPGNKPFPVGNPNPRMETVLQN